MTLKFYYDLLSQPCRALYIVLKLSKINFEACPVALLNGAHLTKEFKTDVSKFQKVPVIHDGDFRLTESIAILRYLSREKDLPEKWYPKDSKKLAKVDEFLEWQHNNIRIFCTLHFRLKWLVPIRTGEPTPPEKLKEYEKRMVESLDLMESLWFSDGPFLTGDSLTAADIWAACEIEQPRISGYDPRVGRPLMAAWLERVKKEIGPYYQEAHVIIEKIAAKSTKEAEKV